MPQMRDPKSGEYISGKGGSGGAKMKASGKGMVGSVPVSGFISTPGGGKVFKVASNVGGPWAT